MNRKQKYNEERKFSVVSVNCKSLLFKVEFESVTLLRPWLSRHFWNRMHSRQRVKDFCFLSYFVLSARKLYSLVEQRTFDIASHQNCLCTRRTQFTGRSQGCTDFRSCRLCVVLWAFCTVFDLSWQPSSMARSRTIFVLSLLLMFVSHALAQTSKYTANYLTIINSLFKASTRSFALAHFFFTLRSFVRV